MSALPVISASAARTLLLQGQGLLDDPRRRAGPSAVEKIVRQLGFVQVDSIQRIERAHHLILGARLDDYRSEHLEHVLFRKRVLFEHWTHDAALIPIEWFHLWKARFAKTEQRLRKSKWFTHRLGEKPEATLAHVYERIRTEGPLRTSDFERTADRPATGWWDWTPEKAALEFLWHTGRLAIHGRDQFQKIYDLTERVFPEAHAREQPHSAAHIEWMCSTALDRLGTATPGELAAFWNAVSIAEASNWCKEKIRSTEIAPVQIESLDGSKPRKGVAVPDWKKRVRHAKAAPDRIRLLAPFDPLVRDRKRVERLFNFDYRFEAFVPAKKRRYGYYVLPVMESDRFVGRIDPRYDRERSTLCVEKVWWEKGIKPTRDRKRKLEAALAILARQIGAEHIKFGARR